MTPPDSLPIARKRLAFTFLALFAFAVAFIHAPQAARAATPEEVEAAIKKGKAYLYKAQNKAGAWDPDKPPAADAHGQWGGITALATYSLLAAGESPDDPRLRKAIEWLAVADMKGIYALGMRANVWPYLRKSKDTRMHKVAKAAMRRDADLLLKAADANGRYGYSTARGGEHNSPSQYGVLGVWAAAQMGLEIPEDYWIRVENGWKGCQGEDGGWCYPSVRAKPGNAQSSPGIDTSSGTMTAAGVASLFITQDFLRSNAGIRCSGNVSDACIEAGLDWISKHYQPAWTDGYFLYGIERIGVASGRKYFGTHDWYAMGAEALVRGQAGDGGWNYGHGGPVVGTPFGLLFLSRGRAPVMMNKLQYSIQPKKEGKGKPKLGPWVQRPRDLANLAQWTGRQLERDLNWQVVNLTGPSHSLLDAPILYIAGDDALNFTTEEKQKLREFAEQGGVIYGHADCGKKAFAESFRALAAELFPKYEMRPLKPDHVMYTNQQFPANRWKGKTDLEGVSNGVRELMLLSPKNDPARAWQGRADKQKREQFEVAADIFQYTVDRQNLRYKGDTYVVLPDPKAPAPKKQLKLARLLVGENPDPEPAGWRRMAAILRNGHAIDLQVSPVRLSGGVEVAAEAGAAPRPAAGRAQPGARRPAASGRNARSGRNAKPGADEANAAPAEVAGASLDGFHVAHLTGTTAFTLSEASRNQLKQFVESGGTLIVDAAGGSATFAEAAERELAATFGGEAAVALAQSLPPDHVLYDLAGSRVDTVAYRRFARAKLGGGRGAKTARLCAWEVDAPAPPAPPPAPPTAPPVAAPPAAQPATAEGAKAAPSAAAPAAPADTKAETEAQPAEAAPAEAKPAETQPAAPPEPATRLAVVFSREDLSAGIVGQPVDGIYGYEPKSATVLMKNLLLYSAGVRRPPPATQPTTQPATQPATAPAPAVADPAAKPADAPAADKPAEPAPPAEAPAEAPAEKK